VVGFKPGSRLGSRSSLYSYFGAEDLDPEPYITKKFWIRSTCYLMCTVACETFCSTYLSPVYYVAWSASFLRYRHSIHCFLRTPYSSWFYFVLFLILTIFPVAAIARPDLNMAGLRRNQGQVRPHGQPEAHRDGKKPKRKNIPARYRYCTIHNCVPVMHPLVVYLHCAWKRRTIPYCIVTDLFHAVRYGLGLFALMRMLNTWEPHSGLKIAVFKLT